MASVALTVKWGAKEYKITDLSTNKTVEDLKNEIYKQTEVLPERQKIIGLKHKGQEPMNDIMLSELNIRPGQKVMMIGTREEQLTDVLSPPKDQSQVINDFDIEEEEVAIENRSCYNGDNVLCGRVGHMEEWDPCKNHVMRALLDLTDEYLSKIDKRVRDLKVTVLNEPRLGKKLLVLDIDYTLFDHRSVAERANELIRPFLHEFLTDVYLHYDIAIWSATSMKWIEVKMKELGVSIHPDYKICFMLDSSAMISIHLPKYGHVDVKPLGVIWGKWTQWSHRNTIMFDDIRKNFLMNPQSGLRIRPFREAHLNRHKDRELVLLTRYLIDIAELDDISTLNHRKWEKYRPHKLPSARSQGHISSSVLSAAVTVATSADQSQDESVTVKSGEKEEKDRQTPPST